MLSRMILALGLLINGPAMAQSVGIKFNEMKVGTALTTESRSFADKIFVATYIGKDGDFHVMQISEKMPDGSLDHRLKEHYDNDGRLAFKLLKDGKNEYSPYSCHYVLGPCTNTYRYLNPFNKKYVVNEQQTDNRLEGDMLIVRVIRKTNDPFEVPFELGPHNLRINSNHTNALGQPSGFKFISLDIPK